jgi:hypothetical protein
MTAPDIDATPQERPHAAWRWYVWGHLIIAASPMVWDAIPSTWNERVVGIGFSYIAAAGFLSILPATVIAMWLGCKSFVDGNYRYLLLFVIELTLVLVQIGILLPSIM